MPEGGGPTFALSLGSPFPKKTVKVLGGKSSGDQQTSLDPWSALDHTIVLQKHYSVWVCARVCARVCVCACGGYACSRGRSWGGHWVHLGFGFVCSVLEWSPFHAGLQDINGPGELAGSGRCVKCGRPFLHRGILCVPRTRRAWRSKSHRSCQSHEKGAGPARRTHCPPPSPSWEMAFTEPQRTLRTPCLLSPRRSGRAKAATDAGSPPTPRGRAVASAPGKPAVEALWASGPCRPRSLQVSLHFKKQHLW